jgi:hypothetical protein
MVNEQLKQEALAAETAEETDYSMFKVRSQNVPMRRKPTIMIAG